MHDRKALVIYGLKVFALFWGLAELAGYLNHNRNASATDLLRGAFIAALIAAALALIAVFALKYTGEDAGS